MNAIRKPWNVRVYYSTGKCRDLGTVLEKTEDSARCAALHKFGRADDEPMIPNTIGPLDEFEVTPVN